MSKSVNDAFQDLQNDIISSAGLTSKEATGFYALHCPICKKESKKTGGIKFEGDKIVYNCFRGSCDASIVYECGEYIPKKFKNLLKELDVKIPLQLRGQKSSLEKAVKRELDHEQFIEHVYKQQEVPDDWVPINESEHRMVSEWEDYLYDRACSPSDVFMIETGIYRGCIAIGMYFYDKLIGFQVLNKGEHGAKYIAHTKNENLVYIPERKPEKIQIIVEGVLDAKCFPNTMATLHSSLSPEQAFQAKDSEFWFLPDRSSNKFLSLMKRYPNSKFIVPNWDYKDLNKAVVELGVMEVAERIKNSLYSNYNEAKIAYQLWKERS